MTQEFRSCYQFGEFTIDTAESTLRHQNRVVLLAPKVFDLLLLFVRHQGEVLDKEALMETLWAGSFVEDSNLTYSISMLRKALHACDATQQFIETLPKRGYRFVAEVREGPESLLHAPLATTAMTRNNYSATAATLPAEAETKAPALALAAPPPRSYWKAGMAGIIILVLGIWLIGTAQKNALSTMPNAPSPILTPSKSDPATIKSIAILPFKQITAHNQDEYLGVGIADTLINRLSRQKQLQVRPLNLAFADGNSDALAAGRAQKVEAVLEGTVQHIGHRLRVNVRFLRLADEVALWAENYEFAWQDYFSTQDAIAERVLKALALHLSPAEQATIARPLTRNAEALQLYLKARYMYSRHDPTQSPTVLSLFQQAIAKDAEFAWAYEGLAATYLRMGYTGDFNAKEAWMQARAATHKALALDPQMAAAYALLSFIEPDNLQAEQFCRRALAIDQNNYEAHLNYSLVLVAHGDFPAAHTEVQKAVELNPLSLEAYNVEAAVYFYAQQYEQACDSIRLVLALEPNYTLAHFMLGDALTQMGQYQKAIDEYKLGAKAMGSAENDDQIAAALALSGQIAPAIQTLNTLKATAQKEYVPAFNLARICIALGDTEQAMTYLQKADEEEVGEMKFIKVDPRFTRLHNDPRWQAILQRRNLTANFPRP